MTRRGKGIVTLGCVLVVAGGSAAWGGWQTGGRLATDSNVARTVDDGTSDQYLWGFLSFTGGGTGEERLDLAFTATAEGALYAEVDEFSYGGFVLSPEALYHLSPSWTASAAPFVLLKGVKDSDQSAVAVGVRLAMRQRLSDRVWAGEHYVYTASRARAEAFSYVEHAVGGVVGASWTRRLWTEIGYDFARGDSFRTVETRTETEASAPAKMGEMAGMGGEVGHAADHRGTAFGFGLVRETVSSHFLTATLGGNLTTALAPYAGYTYRVTRGDLGTATSHIGFLGVGYRF